MLEQRDNTYTVPYCMYGISKTGIMYSIVSCFIVSTLYYCFAKGCYVFIIIFKIQSCLLSTILEPFECQQQCHNVTAGKFGSGDKKKKKNIKVSERFGEIRKPLPLAIWLRVPFSPADTAGLAPPLNSPPLPTPHPKPGSLSPHPPYPFPSSPNVDQGIVY